MTYRFVGNLLAFETEHISPLDAEVHRTSKINYNWVLMDKVLLVDRVDAHFTVTFGSVFAWFFLAIRTHLVYDSLKMGNLESIIDGNWVVFKGTSQK